MLCIGAVGFLVAAEATHERHLREPHEPEYWPAISVNLCYAIELSLKSFIAMRGGEEELLKKISHNLLRGLETAQDMGFVPTHPATKELVTILSPFHVSSSLRYLEGKAVDIPDTRNMIAIARQHLQDIGSQLPVSDIDPPQTA